MTYFLKRVIDLKLDFNVNKKHRIENSRQTSTADRQSMTIRRSQAQSPKTK